jgi:hypothetical protein
MKRIPLTKGKYALVDDEDLEELNQYSWSLSGNGYAHRSSKSGEFSSYRPVRMHRHILGAGKGQVVDHINGDGLDNRRQNLRLCQTKDNVRNRNKDGAKGVTFQAGKWVAQITVNYENIYLGRFVDKEQAMRAYDEAAKKHFKQFANVNFKETA